MKKLVENIAVKVLARSDKRNRRKGQLKTIILTALQVVSNSNILAPYPIAKTLVDVASGVLLKEVYKHAITNNEGL